MSFFRVLKERSYLISIKFSYFRTVNPYLKKYGFQSPKIETIPYDNLGIAVVIPCHNEPDILTTLASLKSCEKPQADYLIIVVVNQSEVTNGSVSKRNLETISEIERWKVSNPDFKLEIIKENSLPKKHAGVGLARKIGMDEAVNLFHQIDKDGIIVALDADCEVEPNYLVEIENHFINHPKTPGCSIRYVHPIDSENESINLGIIQYELHLRYYNQALRMCSFPYAFHTVGSSMAVRSSAYQKQGGMNKRKAGEDFYFLQKIIELGGFTELNSTCVIPSPRVSDRVPFGTGRAIGEFLEQGSTVFDTYNFESFIELKEISKWTEKLFRGEKITHNNPSVNEFLLSIDFENKVEEIRNNTSSFINFEKRFFTFFNAFIVLKFTHFMRDKEFANQSIEQESKNLLAHCYQIECNNKSIKKLLELYRNIEANHEY